MVVMDFFDGGVWLDTSDFLDAQFKDLICSAKKKSIYTRYSNLSIYMVGLFVFPF